MSLLSATSDTNEASETTTNVEAPSEQLESKDKQDAGTETKQEEPSWWWDEKTPGTGERPDFLPEKFKTVSDMAKAQKELENKLGRAPDKYDFSKGESWIDEEYEPFQKMAEMAKQNHIPQYVMDTMLESVGSYLDEFKPNLEEEKAKLGENAGERLTVLNNWAKSNLSEKSFEALSGAMQSAEAVEAMEELRSKMIGNESSIPGPNDGIAAAGLTLEEYRSELNDNYSKYKSDPTYRKKMEQKLERIIKG